MGCSTYSCVMSEQMEHPLTKHLTEVSTPPRNAVYDHGELHREEFETHTLDKRRGTFTVLTDATLTSDELSKVATAVELIEPSMKACFSNALLLWNADNDFNYVEGYMYPHQLSVDIAMEHAWNTLNRKLIDVTAQDDWEPSYYGVEFTDEELLREYVEVGLEESVWGIIGNHRNRFKWLRNHGYLA